MQVAESCPAGLALRIKHLQGRLVGVFCFMPGRPQLPRDRIAWHSALAHYDVIGRYTFLPGIMCSAAMKKQLIDKNMN
jgi:hypothetical protein